MRMRNKTFSLMNKKIKVNKEKEQVKLMNVDRQCFRRLVVVDGETRTRNHLVINRVL